MDPKTLELLKSKPEKGKIKTFDQAFEFACKVRPTWQDNRSKKSQAENVRRDFKHFKQIAGVNVPLEIMDSTFITLVRDRIKEERGWDNKTVNAFLSTIRTVFEEALAAGQIKDVPRIQRLPISGGRTEWFTQDQVEELCKTAKSYEDNSLADIMLFAAYTGLRSQELRLLRARDFDFRHERPFINVGGTPDTATKTDLSGISWRTVPIADRILPLAHRLVDGVSLEKRVFGELFPNRQVIARRFERARDLVMYHDRTITRMHKFKSLRDTFGTWQCAAGVTLIQVSRIMGHTDPKQTLKYVHNTMDYVVNCGNAI
jgi:integrase